MKKTSPSTIQLTLSQSKRPFAAPTKRPIQVNSWVNTALSKRQASSSNHDSSQMVEVHFAFSKSILNKR